MCLPIFSEGNDRLTHAETYRLSKQLLVSRSIWTSGRCPNCRHFLDAAGAEDVATPLYRRLIHSPHLDTSFVTPKQILTPCSTKPTSFRALDDLIIYASTTYLSFLPPIRCTCIRIPPLAVKAINPVVQTQKHSFVVAFKPSSPLVWLRRLSSCFAFTYFSLS